MARYNTAMVARLPVGPLRHVVRRIRFHRWRRSLPSQVRALLPLPVDLTRQIDAFNRTMNVLPGGWCPKNKQHLLAGLILARRCQLVVEIGVFQGGAFFPMAAAARRVGGRAIGIDPYTSDAAEQKENLERFVPIVGANWHTRVDWEGLHGRVLQGLSEHHLTDAGRILRTTSSAAVHQVPDGIDLLHIDGNHDSEAVAADIAHYVPKMTAGGLLVLDDTHWDGVNTNYERLKPRCTVIYEAPPVEGRPEWVVLAIR